MQPSSSARDDAAERPQVEVRRSAKRRRTVSAYREDGLTVVLIPARMSRADERRWVEVMLKRLDTQDRRRKPSDIDLLGRATDLSRLHLDGRAQPSSVRWVTNQGSRWGSCTLADGSIRLSHRLQSVPRWVIDYVLVHELAHLLVADHSAAFWDLVGRYPRAERARGYLDGYSAAAGLEPAGGALPDVDVDDTAATDPAVERTPGNDLPPAAFPAAPATRRSDGLTSSAAPPATRRRHPEPVPAEPLW